MWRVLRPGGWTMIFDFRYSNPRNTNVRKVTDVELLRLWPAERRHYRSLVLAPPLSRAMSRLPWLLPELLAALRAAIALALHLHGAQGARMRKQ
jgi:hypothetical protein